MTCTACGAEVPDGARFCPACGQALVARPDERRVATVLFADLVGFTTFSEAADPEHVKNLVDRCFDRLAADITAFGGRVDKVVGDALVALFGAPVAHEDDPERAVRAALALQESMESFCREHDVTVKLRVGVNTGEVLVGGLRAGDDYTAMGDVVNIASRLQAAAQPGQVLVGPDTHDATRAVVRYDPAGELDLRGREQTMTTWVAREPLTRPGRRMLRGDTDLIGRDRELALLRESLISASERRRALLLLLIGEAGVGKSRLASEIPRCDIAMPATVLVGQCVPYGEANIWAPVGDAIREGLGLESVDWDDDPEVALAERTGEVLGLPVDDDETVRVTEGLLAFMGRSSVDVDPGRAREEAIRAIQVVLDALASRGLVVLVLSDLHWADAAILDLIDSLLLRLRDRPLVVMATTRPELSDRWSPSTRHETTVMHLDPLDADATTELIRSHLGADTPDTVVDLLLERSGGNPFFIEELAALTAESDVDLQTLASRGGPDDRVRAMPATLRGLVAARLDALDPGAHGMLEDCAVAGSTGPVTLIAALAESRGEQDVTGQVAVLAERDLLRVDEDEFTFKSELIREIAYGTLTKAERARRHAVAGAWFEGLEREQVRETDQLEQRAMHYGTAAELARELGGVDGVPSDLTARAIRAHEAAARHAEHAEVWWRAEHHFDAAIALADDEQDHHVDWLLGRIRARVERHRTDDVRAELERATTLADAASDPSLRVQSLLVRGLFEHRVGNYDAAVDAYDQAVVVAREQGHDQAVGEGLRGRGLALMFRGDLDAAEDALAPALEIFRTIENRRGEAWALQNLAWIAFYRGQPALADERLGAAVSLFTELRDWGGLDWALGLLAWVRFNQGFLAEGEELARRVLANGEESGDPWALGMMGVLLAQVALWRGRPLHAIDRSLEAQQRFEPLDDAYGLVQSLAPRARALACLGRLDEARGALDQMRTIATRTDADIPAMPAILAMAIAGHLGEPDWADEGAVGLSSPKSQGLPAEEQDIAAALSRLQAGELAEARDALERSYREASSNSAAGAAGGLLAMARAATGDAQEAFGLTDDLVGLEAGSYLDRIQAWMGRALAAAQLGWTAAGREAADRAVELADATESPLDHAVTRLARAVVLERLDDPAAEEAFEDAHRRLHQLGVTASGWFRVFRAAAHGADAPAASR